MPKWCAIPRTLAKNSNTPVLGDVQLCDISLDEGSVAMVTIVLPVPLHKAVHEVDSSHMASPGQQVAGVTTVETFVSKSTCLKSRQNQ